MVPVEPALSSALEVLRAFRVAEWVWVDMNAREQACHVEAAHLMKLRFDSFVHSLKVPGFEVLACWHVYSLSFGALRHRKSSVVPYPGFLVGEVMLCGSHHRSNSGDPDAFVYCPRAPWSSVGAMKK